MGSKTFSDREGALSPVRRVSMWMAVSLGLCLLVAVPAQSSAENARSARVGAHQVQKRPVALTRPGYVDKESLAWKAYRTAASPRVKRKYYNLAATPAGVWLIGSAGGISRLRTALHRSQRSGTVPQFVLYSIPGRDCGGLAAGGSASLRSYTGWIDRVAGLIGQRAVIVIMEPDAISFCNNNPAVRKLRSAAMTYAARTLRAKAPNAVTYIHAGSGQLPLRYAVAALRDTGIGRTRGFALNVASHGPTSVEQRYGVRLVRRLAKAGIKGKRYVVDTSRNGVWAPDNPGAPYYSCNNFRAALGTRPTTNTSGKFADAYLWIKPPGESDGQCRARESSGWFPSLARSLVRNARTAGTVAYWKLPR